MILSGFTFIRNALKYDFPVVEAIESMLPLVDELIVNIGYSEDGTEDLIAKIPNPKIKILRSQWNDAKTDSGLVLSEQTNLALKACRFPWALYLQADEALHESELSLIRETVEAEHRRPQPVDGFRFRYFHFYGGYTLLQRPWNWYPTEIRIVRTDRGIESFGDAQTFRKHGGLTLQTRLMPAHVYHYGHARAPEKMKSKIIYFHRFWHGDNHGISVDSPYKFQWKNLVWFWGSHPGVYKARVQQGTWSFKPSLLSHVSQDVVIFTKEPNHSLVLYIKTAVESQKRTVKIATSWWQLVSLGLRKKRTQSILLDLEGNASWLSVLLFAVRIVHVPHNRLCRLRQKFFYNFINWGDHENLEGFHVPSHVHGDQLLRWLGVER